MLSAEEYASRREMIRDQWLRQTYRYRRVLKRNGGSLAAAAREVGLSPRTFRRRLYGVK